jgi:hypothetical protein
MLLSKVVVVVGEREFPFGSTDGLNIYDREDGRLVVVYHHKKQAEEDSTKPRQTMAVFTKWDYWLATEGTPESDLPHE